MSVLNFAVLAQLAQLIYRGSGYYCHIRGLRLNPRQRRTLEMLRWHPMSVTELANDMGVSFSTVSGSVVIMRNRGLICKSRSDGDHRRWEMALTTRGREIADMLQTQTTALNDVIQQLSTQEQDMLLQIVKKLTVCLQPPVTAGKASV